MIKPEEPLTTCPTCSGHFKPHNHLQKYCDSSCRNKANYKKHKRINRGELIAWIEANKIEIPRMSDFEKVTRYGIRAEELLEFLGEM